MIAEAVINDPVTLHMAIHTYEMNGPRIITRFLKDKSETGRGRVYTIGYACCCLANGDFLEVEELLLHRLNSLVNSEDDPLTHGIMTHHRGDKTIVLVDGVVVMTIFLVNGQLDCDWA